MHEFGRTGAPRPFHKPGAGWVAYPCCWRSGRNCYSLVVSENADVRMDMQLHATDGRARDPAGSPFACGSGRARPRERRAVGARPKRARRQPCRWLPVAQVGQRSGSGEPAVPAVREAALLQADRGYLGLSRCLYTTRLSIGRWTADRGPRPRLAARSRQSPATRSTHIRVRSGYGPTRRMISRVIPTRRFAALTSARAVSGGPLSY